MHRSTRAKVGTVIGFIIILVWCLLPIAWIVSLSLKPVEETATGSPQFLPETTTLENYRTVLDDNLFQRALFNSFGISLIATTLSVIIATLCAYAIARLQFTGKRLVLTIALAIAMFPVVSLVGPLFDMWTNLGLFNTWLGLIIPYMSFTLPLAIWTLSAFFREIPWEMEQAAQVDGATSWQAFRKVIVPLAADDHVARGDVLEPDDHPQQRRLPAPRRPDEDHELAVGDIDAHVVHRGEAVAVLLDDVLHLDGSHGINLSLRRTSGRRRSSAGTTGRG